MLGELILVVPPKRINGHLKEGLKKRWDKFQRFILFTVVCFLILAHCAPPPPCWIELIIKNYFLCLGVWSKVLVLSCKEHLQCSYSYLSTRRVQVAEFCFVDMKSIQEICYWFIIVIYRDIWFVCCCCVCFFVCEYSKQAEAEAVPSSSLVEVKVGVEVESYCWEEQPKTLFRLGGWLSGWVGGRVGGRTNLE